MMKHLCQ